MNSSTPTDAGARPLRRDAAENRDRLLAAASLVFAEQGLEASVADIAKAAGVGMGTLYRRFPNKEALVDALFRETLEAMIGMSERAIDEPDGGGLEQFLLESSAFLAERRGYLPRLWSSGQDLVQTSRELATVLLEQAKRHNRVRDDLTITDLAVVLWSIRGIVEMAGDLAPDAWQRHVELVIAGMRPTGRSLVHASLTPAQEDQMILHPHRRP